jgi:hypothetical protein
MSLIYRNRGSSGTQLDVMSGDVRIATLWKNKSSVTSGAREEWRWTCTMSVGPPGFAVHGNSDSKAEAQATLELAWQTWLTAAGLSHA